MYPSKPLDTFFRYLRQDYNLNKLFLAMLENQLTQAENDLKELAQDALFHSEQHPYALSQHGKVEAFKELITYTKKLNRY